MRLQLQTPVWSLDRDIHGGRVGGRVGSVWRSWSRPFLKWSQSRQFKAAPTHPKIFRTKLKKCFKPQTMASAFIFFQIQLFFSMRIRIQQLFKCGSGSSLTKFETNYLMKSWNRKKIAQNLKNNGACPIYLTFYNTITISTNFLAFFNFFPQILPLLDPDPLIECGSGKLNLCP